MKRFGIYFFFAATLFAKPTCAIRGTVVDALSNKAVARAQVFADLASEDDNSGPPVRRVADAHGNFCFENLIPGDYFLHVKAASYLDNIYGEKKHGDEGEAVQAVSDEATAALTIKIVPSAAITGSVVDDEGDPVSQAYVLLLKPDEKKRPKVLERMKTDDRGGFRFGGLTAGTYFISATPDRRVLMSNMLNVLDENGNPHTKVQGKTYYRDAISLADATPLPIKAGQQIDRLTIVIMTAEARHVSGKLSAELLNMNSHSLFLVERTGGEIPLSVSVPIKEDGSFLIDGLFPGAYLLQGDHVKQPIDLTTADLDGVNVELQKPVEVRVKINIGPNRFRVSSVVFEPQTGFPSDGDIQAARQSGSTFTAIVSAGQYEIGATTDVPCVVDHVLINGVRQDGSLLTIKNGDTPKSIEMFLAPSPNK